MTDVRLRGETLNGFTDKMVLISSSGRKRTYLVTVNYDDEGPVELILTAGRSGNSENADAEAMGRLISLALQQRVPLLDVVKTLENIQGDEYGTYGQKLVHSKADLCAAALSVADTRFMASTKALQEEPKDVNYEGMHGGNSCPECGAEVVLQEGCMTCPACGWSKCG